jgi:hypothetical protein
VCFHKIHVINTKLNGTKSEGVVFLNINHFLLQKIHNQSTLLSIVLLAQAVAFFRVVPSVCLYWMIYGTSFGPFGTRQSRTSVGGRTNKRHPTLLCASRSGGALAGSQLFNVFSRKLGRHYGSRPQAFPRGRTCLVGCRG